MLNKGNTKQFIMYAGIGAVGTGGHFMTLILLVELAGVSAVWATTAGFVVGALINYILNYHLTFRSDKAHRETMSKFFIVALVGAGLNMMIMFFGVDVLALFYLLAQVIASSVVLLWTFAANKLWTFSEDHKHNITG